MSKKVAVLAVNPVNGMGLFQYLEAFFENGIEYKTFAVADNKDIKTNSGITLITDDIVANLKGKENNFDAVVFACGDAIPKFSENVSQEYNQDMLSILKTFADEKKIIIGHCGAALFLDQLNIADGKKVTVHPYVKGLINNATATDSEIETDGNIYTAQTESAVALLIPEILKVLK